MSQAMLAIQNIVQNSNIHFTPFGEKKLKQFLGSLPTSVSYLNPPFTKGEGVEPTPQRFFFDNFCKSKSETPKFA